MKTILSILAVIIFTALSCSEPIEPQVKKQLMLNGKVTEVTIAPASYVPPIECNAGSTPSYCCFWVGENVMCKPH